MNAGEAALRKTILRLELELHEEKRKRRELETTLRRVMGEHHAAKRHHLLADAELARLRRIVEEALKQAAMKGALG